MSVSKVVANGQLKLQEILLSIKPESPKRTYQIKNFTWLTVGDKARFKHVALAGITLLVILAITYPVMRIPILNDSIASFIAKGIQALLTALGVKGNFISILTIGVVVLLIAWRNNVKSVVGIGPVDLILNLPYYALREELMFRTGSEDWTFWQKVRSCISFGLMHFTMIIVPIGACIALMVAGAILMTVYTSALKTGNNKHATVEAALVHTSYNALIILVLIGSLFWTLIQALIISIQLLMMLK